MTFLELISFACELILLSLKPVYRTYKELNQSEIKGNDDDDDDDDYYEQIEKHKIDIQDPEKYILEKSKLQDELDKEEELDEDELDEDELEESEEDDFDIVDGDYVIVKNENNDKNALSNDYHGNVAETDVIGEDISEENVAEEFFYEEYEGYEEYDEYIYDEDDYDENIYDDDIYDKVIHDGDIRDDDVSEGNVPDKNGKENGVAEEEVRVRKVYEKTVYPRNVPIDDDDDDDDDDVDNNDNNDNNDNSNVSVLGNNTKDNDVMPVKEPSEESIPDINGGNPKERRRLLSHWIVYGVFRLFEEIVPSTFPSFDVIKIVIIVLLVTMGTDKYYKQYLRSFFNEHSAAIDRWFGHFEQAVDQVASTTAAVRSVADNVKAAAMNMADEADDDTKVDDKSPTE